MLAPAKLNLCLHVGPKRPDGYHDLFSLVTFAEIGDELFLEPARQTELIVEGPFADDLSTIDNTDNIVWAAASHLSSLAEDRGDTVQPFRMRLIKRLPVASGVGGGSADAAVALRLVAQHLGLGLDAEDLRRIGLSLGADVPVCLFGATAWMSGIGEELSPGPVLPEVHLVLANPRIPLSTKAVFERFDASADTRSALGPEALPAAFDRFDDLVVFLQSVRNDLELPARQAVREIGDVLDALSACGAGLARMSGSGATCFGLFSSKTEAEAAAERLRLRQSEWWIDVGALISE